MSKDDAEAIALEIVEAVTKALGTKLANYMPRTQENALEAAYNIICRDVKP